MSDVRCDRCHTVLPFYQKPVAESMSVGYYVHTGWAEFMNPGELNVCDCCMWADPRYIKVYGTYRCA